MCSNHVRGGPAASLAVDHGSEERQGQSGAGRVLSDGGVDAVVEEAAGLKRGLELGPDKREITGLCDVGANDSPGVLLRGGGAQVAQEWPQSLRPNPKVRFGEGADGGEEGGGHVELAVQGAASGDFDQETVQQVFRLSVEDGPFRRGGDVGGRVDRERD